MLSQLARLLRGNRELSAFLFCAAASFILLALPPVARDGISFVVSSVVLAPVHGPVAYVQRLVRASERDEALEDLALRLAEERQGLVAYRDENERLRELVHSLVTFSMEEHFETLSARVIGVPGGRIAEAIVIDQGSSDRDREKKEENGREAGGATGDRKKPRVDTGMAVVVPEGLVGKITRVYPDHSIVQPLTSASSAVSAIVERSRIRGVVRPRLSATAGLTSWEMDYVPARSDVVPGDLVVTSGMGGVYPPGLEIGRVTSVSQGPLTTEVRIRLGVDFATLDQVFVITGTRPGPPGLSAEEEDILREIERTGRGPGTEEPR
jgi:rod shape-determining protein MreC